MLSMLTASSTLSYGREACGRAAIINNQPVLVDISSTSKGEGLRPYLNKDEVAKSYLDQYQEKVLSPNKSALIGTVAIGLIVSGLLLPSDKDLGPFKSQDLIITGFAALVINFLVAEQVRSKNENLLLKSIDEYNKRNRPRIYFLPYQSGNRWSRSGEQGGLKGLGLIAGLQLSF